MGQFAALRTQKIEGFEELKEVVLGTRREIVQLERGKIKGEIAHAVIGDLPIDTASFNLGIRTKGGSHRDRIGIGLLAAVSAYSSLAALREACIIGGENACSLVPPASNFFSANGLA